MLRRALPLGLAFLFAGGVGCGNCGGSPPVLPGVCADACAQGTTCKEGKCVDSRCVDVECTAGSVCAKGDCYPVACQSTACGSGEACVQERCIAVTCIGVHCKVNEACVEGECAPRTCDAQELYCSDHDDNDCDGLADCADPDCKPACSVEDGGTDGGPQEDGGSTGDGGDGVDGGDGGHVPFTWICVGFEDGGTAPYCPDGWCWDNPAPSPFSRFGPFFVAPTQEVLSLGSPARWNGSYWAEDVTQPSATSLWNEGPSDVWAAWNSHAQRWNGTSWTTLVGALSGPVQALGVWGNGPSEAWVVGSGPSGATKRARSRWNGTDWSGSYTTDFGWTAIWGASPSDLYAVGRSAATSHWNGVSWNDSATQGATEDLRSVYGFPNGDVWAVGTSGLIRKHFAGPYFGLPVPSGTSENLNAVWGAAPDDVWAVGTHGAIVHYDGVEWSSSCTPTAATLSSVWGTSSTDVWAGTSQLAAFYASPNERHDSKDTFQDAALLHWNGSVWTAVLHGKVTSVTGTHLHGIWGSSRNDLWAISDLGVFLHRGDAGEPWAQGWLQTPAVPAATVNLNAVSQNYAVGWSGALVQLASSGESTLVSYDAGAGTNWNAVSEDYWGKTLVVGTGGSVVDLYPSATKIDLGTTASLNGVWVDGDFGYIAGSDGGLWRKESGSWVSVGSGTTQDLNAVGFDGFNLWAVGNAGATVVCQVYPASCASKTTSVGSNALSGVWGWTPDVWATSLTTPYLFKWNGSDWTPVSLPSPQPLFAISGFDRSNVWAVGASDSIFYWNGSSWALQYSGPSWFSYWKGVWAGGSGYGAEAWTVGTGGRVLHYNGTSWDRPTATYGWRGVSGSGASDVWLVGERGATAHFNGAGWNWVDTVTPFRTLNRVASLGGSNAWAVGDEGTVLRWQGSGWGVVSSPTAEPLHALWAFASTDVWAAGDADSVVRWNGVSWSLAATGRQGTSWTTAWGAPTGELWLGGAAGAISRWNGAWAQGPDAPLGTVTAMHGTSASDVWASSAAGLSHWNGVAWSAPVRQELSVEGLWGDSQGVTWAVGPQGKVVRYEP